jgi:AraC-like DNA-binding protein
MRTGAETHQNSILVTWVRAFGRALDAAGCDGAALLAQAGFDLRHLGGPDARCCLTRIRTLARIALEATRDEAFGVKLGSHFTHASFHALGYGLRASSTLKEAFERVEHYSQVVSDAVACRLERCGAQYHFYLELKADLPIESIDPLIGVQLRMCRSLIGRDFSPLAVELQRPRPRVLDDFERLWRSPLHFGAGQNRLIFDVESIERRLDTGNLELARLSDAIAAQYLARIERYDIEARVRDVLAQRLPDGEPRQQDVAESLNMSSRTLQRKLGDSGTTFREIVDQTRHTQALLHLDRSQTSVEEVTRLLGFSCSSSFTRSFRRWTGVSPSAWRAARAAGQSKTMTPRPGRPDRRSANACGASSIE